jgi:hypothetical protein
MDIHELFDFWSMQLTGPHQNRPSNNLARGSALETERKDLIDSLAKCVLTRWRTIPAQYRDDFHGYS